VKTQEKAKEEENSSFAFSSLKQNIVVPGAETYCSGRGFGTRNADDAELLRHAGFDPDYTQPRHTGLDPVSRTELDTGMRRNDGWRDYGSGIKAIRDRPRRNDE
jgi:hypothetical protein